MLLPECGSTFSLRCRVGKWFWPAPVLRQVSLLLPPLRDILHKKQIISLLCVPVPFRSLFLCCRPPRWFLCLLSKSTELPSVLYPNQAHWALKLQALSPTSCKNSQNSIPLVFQDSGYGLCVPLCSPFSCSLPLQPARYVFPLKHMSALITFFTVAPSFPLVVKFVLTVFRSISRVFMMIW